MKEEKVKRMNAIYNYCFICNKRNGSWYYDCHPSSFRVSRHGNGKIVRERECKSWKHNRKLYGALQKLSHKFESCTRLGKG